VDFSSPTLDATRDRLLVRFGARVTPWWDQLPEVLAELAERWELVVGDAVGRGNTSLVVRCRRADGRPAVLKLTPDAELGAAEASALRSWESSGRVPLVWGYDAALGALLLEAIPSEIPLSELGMAN
jgi:streptomycin 6-kinase